MSIETTSAAAARDTAPHIITELPGPRARAMIERDLAVASPSLTRAYPLVAESGSGMVVTDVDGNRFLDFAAGIAVASTGHAHPEVVQAIKEQADRLIHIAATDFYEPRYLEFMERLAAIAPFDEAARVFLTNSGTEAVEGAIKLARYHTHRPGIIAFEGGFHGRTLGALSLTNSKIKQRAGFGPLLPMVHHAPFPRIRAWRESSGGDGSAELEVLRSSILGRIIAPSDVAAIVIEPVQGEGGYFPAPEGFLAGPARDLRRARHPAHRRRDPVRDGPHRALVGDRARRRPAGHRDHRQGDRLRHAALAPSSPANRSGPGRQAPTARPLPATRSARRPGSPRWTSWRAG